MKISSEYDGKTVNVKMEIPPSELKGLVKKVFDFLLGLSVEASQAENSKKGERKRKGGS